MNRSIRLLLTNYLWLACCSLGLVASAQTNDPLTDGVRQGKGAAFEKAGDEGRHDLIPLLEAYLKTPASPLAAGHVAARNALAKLGVEKYREELVEQLENPTNSAVYGQFRQYREMSGSSTSDLTRLAAWETQQHALERLAKVKDATFIPLIASYLYNTNPVRTETSMDVVDYGSLADYAIRALILVVTNPPLVGIDDYTAWQNWWEQHKQDYVRLEFGKPLPSQEKPSTEVGQPQPTPKARTSVPTAQDNAGQDKDSHWNTLIPWIITMAACGLVFWWLTRRRNPDNH